MTEKSACQFAISLLHSRERNGVIKVAHNMLAAGIALATAAEFTGLTLDAVLALNADADSGNGKH